MSLPPAAERQATGPDVPASLPGILLAAGSSRRMGSCKLLLPLGGKPLIAHAALAGLGALSPLVAVIGPHTPPEVEDALRSIAVSTGSAAEQLSVVVAEQAASGQAESLKAGLGRVLALRPDAPGVAVLLGDQPLVTQALLQRLIAAFFDAEKKGETACVAPSFAGQRGNPVLLHRSLFDAVSRLTGDEGGRSLLAAFPPRLVSCPDDACLVDVDKPENYARIAGRFA